METNLPYSESADLNVNYAFTAISRLEFDQISWHHGIARLTDKINHHTFPPRCSKDEVISAHSAGLTHGTLVTRCS